LKKRGDRLLRYVASKNLDGQHRQPEKCEADEQASPSEPTYAAELLFGFITSKREVLVESAQFTCGGDFIGW
jgi:hypothetical protein